MSDSHYQRLYGLDGWLTWLCPMLLVKMVVTLGRDIQYAIVMAFFLDQMIAVLFFNPYCFSIAIEVARHKAILALPVSR